MDLSLTENQLEAQQRFRRFVGDVLLPCADLNDQEERTPPELIEKIASEGCLRSFIPEEHGGLGFDMLTHGLLCEEIGRASSSVLSLITVHGMVSHAILKWGTPQQVQNWIPKLASGECIGAFGLTEPEVGSDAKNVKTVAREEGDKFVLNGVKRWISFGEVADLILVFAQYENQPTAFLVETDRPGISIKPIRGMLGFRSAMLAEIQLNECDIPQENILGNTGFGFSHVAGSALDYGRFCVAWGCVGLGESCLQASLEYTKERKQFGQSLSKHQLIRAMITDMITNIKAARLLCYQAAYSKDSGEFSTIMDSSIAKYFASKMINQVAGDAVQIHGANGCSSDFPVQRYMRDAKIMEIIEGSTQMQQVLISNFGYQMMT